MSLRMYKTEPEQVWGNMIICAGGGYEWLSPREEDPVAQKYAEKGLRTWVLEYPVCTDKVPPMFSPLEEAIIAVADVREQYPDEPVFVCGFSAGGHVAGSLAVHWNDREHNSDKDLKAARPDGVVLSYPVITTGEYAHRGSVNNLLGENPSDKDLEYFSLEKQISENTPPIFIWHTSTDRDVPVQNSLLFAEALAERKAAFELHIYPEGVHGLSLATSEVEETEKERYANDHIAEWFEDSVKWLKLISSKQKQVNKF